jgi:hypothetical protein
MPLQATSGAASYDAFGGGVVAEPNYIESVFSCFLYTGNGSTQTITNGIDLSGKGGMVWQKVRTDSGSSTQVFDTNRGVYQRLATAQSNAQFNWSPYGVTAFNNNGFTIADTSGGDYGCNGSPGGTYAGNGTYVSWTFRKQPKFFDVVTYTGTGSSRTVAHNLGSTPGCIIIKRTSGVENWTVYHRSQGANKVGFLNLTNAFGTNNTIFGNTSPTSTVFTLGDADAGTNANGSTYVAYLFAHNAGGFGLTGTDNVISCGSYTGNGSTNGPVVTLGYEPQWIMVKNAGNTGGWIMSDIMRGLDVTNTQNLIANDSASETSANIGHYAEPTSTGFKLVSSSASSNQSATQYIYIAIRRGPMKVPTDATKVFVPVNQTVSSSSPVTTNFPVDMTWDAYQSNAGNNHTAWDRLRGSSQTSCVYLQVNKTDAESSAGAGLGYDNNTGYLDKFNSAGYAHIYWNFRRAPSFFDVVCYTGTGSATTISHNLGVAPELMIVKSRSLVKKWPIYSAATGPDYVGVLNTTADFTNPGANEYWDTAPTASVFTVKTNGDVNTSAATYVAYLFATCPGVSKVGSYTGTATTLQINCGFTGGARFVLIKRTDSTGSWYVWDVARGISSGNDPYLLLNSTAAEVTNTDYIDAYSAGFEISSTAPAEINASGGSFIFLAIS